MEQVIVRMGEAHKIWLLNSRLELRAKKPTKDRIEPTKREEYI